MTSMMRRLVGAALAGALTVASLAGCAPRPATTAELLDRYSKVENKDNYHFDRTVSIGSSDGDAFSITTVGDVAGTRTHATTQGDFFGVSLSFETYSEPAEEGFVSYMSTKVAENTMWLRKAEDKQEGIASLLAPEVMGDAEFAATENGYTLTIPASTFISALVKSDLALETIDERGSNAFSEAFEGAQAVYEFDADARLTSISCDATITESEQDGTTTGEATTRVNYTLSGYGTVTDDAVTVPDNVKSEAVDLDAIGSSVQEFLNQVGSAVDTVAQGFDSFVTMLGDAANSLSSEGDAATQESGEATDGNVTTQTTEQAAA